MIAEGRTIRQAIEAGNYYRIVFESGGVYDPPAATEPAEVMAWARKMFPGKIGQVVEVQRVLDQTIGCTYVEEIGTETL